jgi:hypothetical protein
MSETILAAGSSRGQSFWIRDGRSNKHSEEEQDNEQDWRQPEHRYCDEVPKITSHQGSVFANVAGARC